MKKQFTIKQNPFCLAIFAAVAVFLGFAGSAYADVTGINVVTVAQQGQPIAVYYKQGSFWVEIGLRANGSVRKFNEIQRDEFSIFLSDGSANLQIDLHTNAVNYEERGQSIPNLYQVIAHHK